MAIIKFNNTTKDTVLTAIRDAIGSAGLIKIYSGTMPADLATAIAAQVLLGTLTTASPCGTVNATTHILEMGAITQDSSADASGTASFARIFKADGTTAVIDIDISTTGGGGTLQMNTTNIVIGGPILISSFTISVA